VDELGTQAPMRVIFTRVSFEWPTARWIALPRPIRVLKKLRAAELLDDFGDDLRPLSAEPCLKSAPSAVKRTSGESDFRARLAVEFLDFDDAPARPRYAAAI